MNLTDFNMIWWRDVGVSVMSPLQRLNQVTQRGSPLPMNLATERFLRISLQQGSDIVQLVSKSNICFCSTSQKKKNF